MIKVAYYYIYISIESIKSISDVNILKNLLNEAVPFVGFPEFKDVIESLIVKFPGPLENSVCKILCEEAALFNSLTDTTRKRVWKAYPESFITSTAPLVRDFLEETKLEMLMLTHVPERPR